MLILLVSFCLWGVGDIFRDNPMQRTVAKVGDDTISVQMLNQGFQRSLAYARNMFHQNVTAEQARQWGLMDTTLQSLINRSLLDQAAAKMGIDVSIQSAINTMAAQPNLRDENGKFSPALFKQFMAQAQLTEKELTSQIARGQLTGVFTTAPDAPKLLTDQLYHAMGQKRVVDIITIKNQSVGDISPKDDGVLKTYYEQNPAPFISPENRTLTVAQLSTDAVAKDIHITDAQVTEEYNTHGEKLMTPERRDLVQVVLQNEAKAKSIYEAAKASGNLSKSAKEAGFDPLPLAGMDEKGLFPELAKPVFTLALNGTTEPIKTSMGYHVIQVSKITPSTKPALKDIKEELRSTMQRDQAVESITATVNKLDDQLAAGHALEDIADELRLRLIKIPAIESNGKTPDGKKPSELPENAEIVKIAFEQNGGETSPIVDDKKGNYFIVRTDEVTASAVKPYDTVKAQVKNLWLAAEQAKQAQAQAEEIAKALREGASVSSLAAKKNLEIHTSKPVSQLGDTDSEIPESAMPQVMKLAKKDALVVPMPDHQIILHIAKIIDADAKPSESAAMRIASEVNAHKSNELLDQFTKHLTNVFHVRIHQDTLQSVKEQGG